MLSKLKKLIFGEPIPYFRRNDKVRIISGWWEGETGTVLEEGVFKHTYLIEPDASNTCESPPASINCHATNMELI